MIKPDIEPDIGILYMLGNRYWSRLSDIGPGYLITSVEPISSIMVNTRYHDRHGHGVLMSRYRATSDSDIGINIGYHRIRYRETPDTSLSIGVRVGTQASESRIMMYPTRIELPSGITTTWTRPDDFVHQGISQYILVWGFHTDSYWYIPPYTKQARYIPVYTVSKKWWYFNRWGLAFRSNHACIHFPRTVQHILVLQLQNDPCSMQLSWN